MSRFWNEERVEFLVICAKRGLTSGAIAQRISHKFNVNLTRNAVIGKLTRIGIPLESSTMKVRSVESRLYKSPDEVRARKSPADSPKVVILNAVLQERQAKAFLYKPFVPFGKDFEEGLYGVLDIPNFRCRYVVSEEGAPLRFCGRAFDVSKKQWWCDKHRQVVFYGGKVKEKVS